MVDDIDGEDYQQLFVAQIFRGKKTLITLDTTYQQCYFSDGDIVRITHVEGMTELNDREFVVVGSYSGKLGIASNYNQFREANGTPLHLDRDSFIIDVDSTGFPEHTCGGRVIKVKTKKEFSFVSFCLVSYKH